MKKYNNAGYSALIIIVLIALIGGGAYYAGTRNSIVNTTQTALEISKNSEAFESTGATITPPSFQQTAVASNKKTYTSTLGVEFEIPKTLYAYDKLAFGSNITILESATRPKELTESCNCDGDLYYSTVRINAYDLLNSKEAAMKEHGSVLFYKGLTQKLLEEENAKTVETFQMAVETAAKAQVKLGKSFVNINKNGLTVVRHYAFSEMNGVKISAAYYVYAGNKVYVITGKKGNVYSATEDALLADIAASFKVNK